MARQGGGVAWEVGDMEDAIRDVQTGKRTLRAASEYYHVPRTTLHDRVRGIHGMDSRRGPRTCLDAKLERKLYDIALEKERDGMTKSDFLTFAGDFAASYGKRFAKGTPSMAWYRKFIERMRKAVALESSHPRQMKTQITNWSPSKRKSTMPRKAFVKRDAETENSDAESLSESESESSSLPSSSESEVEFTPSPPKKKKTTRALKKKQPARKKKSGKPAPCLKRKYESDTSDFECENSDDENMFRAIEAVKKKKMTYQKAAQEFGVPRSTLHDHVKKGYHPGTKPGIKPALNEHLEKELYELAVNRMDLGLSRADFLEMAGDLAAEHNAPFKNGRPSDSWLRKMMKRCRSKKYKVTEKPKLHMSKLRLRFPGLSETDMTDESPSKTSNTEQSDHPYSVPLYNPPEVEIGTSSKKKRRTGKNDAIRTGISNRVKSALEEHLTREEPFPSRIEQLADLAESMSQELALHRAQIEREREERNMGKLDKIGEESSGTKSDLVIREVYQTSEAEFSSQDNSIVEEAPVVEIREEQGGNVDGKDGGKSFEQQLYYTVDFDQVKMNPGGECVVVSGGDGFQGVAQEQTVAVPVIASAVSTDGLDCQISRPNKPTRLQEQRDFFIVCDPDESLVQTVKIEDVLKQLTQATGPKVTVRNIESCGIEPEAVQCVQIQDAAHPSASEVQGIQIVQVPAIEEVVQETETMQEGIPEEYLIKTEQPAFQEEVQHHVVVESTCCSTPIVLKDNNVQYVIAEEVSLNEEAVTYVIADEGNVVMVP